MKSWNRKEELLREPIFKGPQDENREKLNQNQPKA